MTRRRSAQGSGGQGTEQFIFPFGQPSTRRPSRRPSGHASLFVLGVYPSALHVRWVPPQWAQDELGVGPVGALAVDDEPTVLWDGADAEARVERWREAVGFRQGDGRAEFGHVAPAGNGTSGRSVSRRILAPLDATAKDTWFTDVVDRYFAKSGGSRRQQADAIAAEYAPFAIRAKRPKAHLPPRPSENELVDIAVERHATRLRRELAEAAAPVIVSLGEEARRVLAALADECGGPPTGRLDARRLVGANASHYGEPGTVRIAGHSMTWHALVHPGQRSTSWRALHDDWIARRRGP